MKRIILILILILAGAMTAFGNRLGTGVSATSISNVIAAKANCVIVYPGNADDDVAIQAALDSLDATGGRVICMPGDYSVDATITLAADQTLEFLRPNTVTLAAESHALTKTVPVYDGTNYGTLVSLLTNATKHDAVIVVPSSLADAGGGNVTVSATGHGFSDGEVVTFSGFSKYNGDYTVANSAENSFTIEKTYVAEACGGTCSVYRRKERNIHIVGANIEFGGTTASGVTGYTTTNYNWAGIWLKNCENSSVEKCTINEVNSDGGAVGRQYSVLVQDCRDTVVRRCHGVSSGYESFGLRGTNIDCGVIDCTGVNNRVHLSQIAPFGVAGGSLYGYSRGCFVVGCKSDSQGSGDDICVHSNQTVPHSFVTVSDNHVSQVSLYGSINGCNAFDNVVRSFYVTGEANSTTENVVIGMNTVIYNQQLVLGGMEIRTLTADGSTIKNINITGNVIKDGSVQIDTNAASTGTISNVTIEGNTFENEYLQTYPLVWLDQNGTAITNVFILDNNLRNLRATNTLHYYGILFDNSTAVDISNIDIKGNSFYVDSSGGVEDDYDSAIRFISTSTGTATLIDILENTFEGSYYQIILGDDAVAATNLRFVRNKVLGSAPVYQFDGYLDGVLDADNYYAAAGSSDHAGANVSNLTRVNTVPTSDQTDGVTIWSDDGTLKVSTAP